MAEFPVTKTDEEWRRILTPEQYQILRGHATDRPGDEGDDEGGGNEPTDRCTRAASRVESPCVGAAFKRPIDTKVRRKRTSHGNSCTEKEMVSQLICRAVYATWPGARSNAMCSRHSAVKVFKVLRTSDHGNVPGRRAISALPD